MTALKAAQALNLILDIRDHIGIIISRHTLSPFPDRMPGGLCPALTT